MSAEDVLAYIPQRPPFVMVGNVISADDKEIHTNFTINPDNIFVRDNVFTEAGLIENMAQSVAAGTGFMAKQSQKAAPVGYIGALKNVVINALPHLNDQLHTKIILLHRVMNASIVQGIVFVNHIEIASCELKIFINETS